MQVNSPFTPYGYCMVWKYRLNRDGYGTVTIGGKQELAHRAVFIQTRGPLPADRQVNHLCNRPYCIQPSHLYAGTAQDNKDDSQIFGKEELYYAPAMLHWSLSTTVEDPILSRLLATNRYDGTEPWEPVDQPAQKPLEEFVCPGHDFAITMLGGHSKICRICETGEHQERWLSEQGTYYLMAEMCSVSQTVIPIYENILKSKFAEESHLPTRRKAYFRDRRGFGSHELRRCSCDYCSRDRIAFRAAIEPLLTQEESQILDVCDRLEPQITTALERASADMMEEWAKAAGLNSQQAHMLREHHKDCGSTRFELTGTARILESELGYLLYAMAKFDTSEEMLEDQMFRQIMNRWSLSRVRKPDVDRIRRTVLPAAAATAHSLAEAWEKKTDELVRPYLESKPVLFRDIRHLAQLLVEKRILEHLRFEFLGRNSFQEREPHPHHSCAISIVQTGQVQPFPRDFVEGMGYTSKPR